jgi:hypothetical protein
MNLGGNKKIVKIGLLFNNVLYFTDYMFVLKEWCFAVRSYGINILKMDTNSNLYTVAYCFYFKIFLYFRSTAITCS